MCSTCTCAVHVHVHVQYMCSTCAVHVMHNTVEPRLLFQPLGTNKSGWISEVAGSQGKLLMGH